MAEASGLEEEVKEKRESGPPAAQRPRDVLFISHASPDENPFAVWLASQLAIAGYKTWCDATQLLGGEKFWKDIEEAIRDHSFRVLYVSTLISQGRAGVQRELRYAFETKEKETIKDFIVPLKIDGFPFEAMPKEIRELNGINFEGSWAEGLQKLLQLLEREGAPKTAVNGPEAVSEWYRRSQNARRCYVVDDEICYSNWFKIRLPQKLSLHCYTGPEEALVTLAKPLALPHRVVGRYLVTFAEQGEIETLLGNDAIFSETLKIETTSFHREGFEDGGIAQQEGFNIVSDLCRQAWEAAMDAKRLGTFEMASGMNARFFTHGQLEKDKAYFQKGKKRRTWRQVVGRKSKRTPEGEKVPDGFWHYAISASPQLSPFPRFVLRHHVIFTDDGEKPWDSAERMHKARRSVCKQWWNKEWRDRLFAFASEISGGEKAIILPVSDQQDIVVLANPMEFTSPWTYYEDRDEGLDEAREIELVEDESAEEDEDEPAT